MRYAHPFFTALPPDERPANYSPYGQRMTDWISQNLGEIPPPRIADPVLDLADVIGQPSVDEIAATGSLKFHAVGDTGQTSVNGMEEQVSDQMAKDYTVGQDALNPAFFLHLGDVIYNAGKDALYTDEFYRQYINYPGKILAVPGNHDGEITPLDKTPLEAFKANFCADTPGVAPAAASAGILRETVTQPGVYYLLRAPFVDVVCMYSNIAEGPGSIVGAGNDTQQKTWLGSTLQSIAAERQNGSRKALVFAVHHPPYSGDGTVGTGQKGGSPGMLADFDEVCTAAGIEPDAVLSGHAHNYQRHTRVKTAGATPIPFIVAGCGGHGNQPAGTANGQQLGDTTYDKTFETYGYLLVTVTATELKTEFYELGQTGAPTDNYTVSLA